MRLSLPVDAVIPDLVARLSHDGALRSRSAVLIAPTGAGKTTRVPPAVAREVRGRVIVTEPRRIAAKSAAARIASELGVAVGAEVGYIVRGETRSRPRTQILCVTEGILLRMLQDDPLLDGTAAIVFDEVHERGVDLDLALALARVVQRDVRPDLALVAMSATVDPRGLAAWLGTSDIVQSTGRTFPVDVHHRAPAGDLTLERAVLDAVRFARTKVPGDVLVFVPGVAEIERCCRVLGAHGLANTGLHGGLELETQDRVIRGGGGAPRVIVATNVAESSLTIPGIRAVVDSGLARVLRYDTALGLDRLDVERVSLASAQQRAGRAGREALGVCVRLWPEAANARLRPDIEPEIERVDLAPILLRLLDWGERDAAAFPWWTPPAPARWTDAWDTLRALRCVDGAALTPLGRRAARMGVHPRLACVVEAGLELGVGYEAAAAAALMTERDLLRRPGAREAADLVSDSDVCDRVELVTGHARPAADVSPAALRRVADAAALLARDIGAARTTAHDGRARLRRALLAGFPDRLAKRREPGSDRLILTSGAGVRADPTSAVTAGDWVVCLDVSAARRGGSEATARLLSEIDPAWIPDAMIVREDVIAFDPARERVASERRTRVGAVVVRTAPHTKPDRDEIEAALARAAASAIPRALAIDDPAFAALRARVRWLARARPDEEGPVCDDDALRAALPELCLGCSSFAELRRVDLADWLRRRHTRAQWSRLESLAPQGVAIPTGRMVALTYPADTGEPPVLEARVQELYGLHDTPTVAGGSIPVRIHLLAPNGRPQQVTSDLRSFWATTYQEVRKELRARYPKHAWPDDPWNAPAESRPRRHR